MSMKDDIYNLLAKGEPMADCELAEALGAKAPSVRRARQELVSEKKVKQQGEMEGNKMWVLASALPPKKHLDVSSVPVEDVSDIPGASAAAAAVAAQNYTDKPSGWVPGDEVNKEARKAEIAERARQLQGGPKLF